MPPPAAGAVTAATLAVILAIVFVDGDDASSALLVPLYALILTPVGALIGWALQRTARKIRNRNQPQN